MQGVCTAYGSFQRGGFAVFADTVFLEIIQVLIKCLQQELITVPETQPCVLDFLGSDIRIPVADALVLLADIGFDVSSFSLMRWATILLPAALLALVSHSLGEIDSLQLNCEIVPLMVMRPMIGALPFCSACRFR